MNQPIHLIINADDLGAGAPTDRGIFEAFTRGIVCSASLLANGPSFKSAIDMALELSLPTGVHLNLSEGSPLAGPIAGLTDSNGQFPGKALSRKQFITGEIDSGAIHNEILAQIDKVKAAGLQPDHIDTHQHCGLFPIVTQAMIAAAKVSGINRMRLSKPTHPENEDSATPLGDELRMYRRLAPAMTEQFIAAGITTPSGLLGMPLLDRLDEQLLAQIIISIPPGIWELMVHPGYFDPDRTFAGIERELELTALTSESIQVLIAQQNIRLISFKELPCAC